MRQAKATFVGVSSLSYKHVDHRNIPMIGGNVKYLISVLRRLAGVGVRLEAQ
jgi:hypothetical protein